MSTTSPADEQRAAPAAGSADWLAERVFGAALGVLEISTIYVGDRLGLYEALATGPGATAADVAAATGTDERYVREWLEQQAVSGIVLVDDPAADPGARRYTLPDGHAEALTDRDSLAYVAAFARMMTGVVRPLPAVVEAFRTGAGVPYADYDRDFCEGQGDMNRVMFVNLLGSSWLPSIPDVDARLRADPPARVADVACGTGHSTLAIAAAYEKVTVDGIDLDEASIGLACSNLEGSGLEQRVSFAVRDAADPELEGGYELVTVFEAVHDLSRPVEVLRAIRGMLAPDGCALVADERVAEAFAAPGDALEQLMYGYSVVHCLPVGRAEQPSAATGTVMRPETMREYALAAGFSELEVLPIENDVWRFYRLSP
jgi:2-polyprenyl-3-methyl-5-hydroxy-6-metoxy-1,4-benzoquinol methylase